ncbi:sigma-70 family RNA polymerase sigma factor, partial [bacterium]|nr:sigma-70 family RNA polymerase sigma factor [bacterium]
MKLQLEHDLLVKAGEFDQDSLAIIYDTYSPGLYRYALRLLGEDHLAEECVADTFSRYLGALRVGHGPTEHLQAYLYRIAHNWITDFYRRHNPIMVELNETIEMAAHDKPENKMIESLQRQQIQVALRTLTPDQRQVIVLRFLEEW